MPASRLLKIQMLLEAKGRISATALSEALGVSVRTLYRDVDRLSLSGVPVYAERGRNGGFRLMDGWKTSLTGMTEPEARAMLMVGLPGPAGQLGLSDDLESARLKLLVALPDAWRDDAQRISARFHLDPVDWYRDSEAVPQLAAMTDALWNQLSLRIRYESWTRTNTFEVAPLGLVLKSGTWYLVAAAGGKPRTYRVSNILSAMACESVMSPPSGFDLKQYWEASIQRFEKDLYRSTATVRCSEKGLKSLWKISSVSHALKTTAPVRESDGYFTATIPVESTDQAADLFLQCAPEVEVIAPASLRRAVRARIQSAARLYEDAV